MKSVNVHADCEYWGLTPVQCCLHHVRLARYYADRCRQKAEKSEKLVHTVLTAATIVVAFAVLAFVASMVQ